MTEEQNIFKCYKVDRIYKNIALHFEKYFLNADELDQETALILLQEKIDLSLTFKSSIDDLEGVLNQDGFIKYRQQYRQYKYRSKNKFKQIQVRPETYEKIKILAKDFDGIDDLLFEYAFDKRYYIDTSKIDHLPTSLSDNEKLKVLLESVEYPIRKLLDTSMQTAFKKGFEKGQKTAKIRSKKGLKEAIELLHYELYDHYI